MAEPALWRRLMWLVALWGASVGVLAVVSLLLRLWLSGPAPR